MGQNRKNFFSFGDEFAEKERKSPFILKRMSHNASIMQREEILIHISPKISKGDPLFSTEPKEGQDAQKA